MIFISINKKMRYGASMMNMQFRYYSNYEISIERTSFNSTKTKTCLSIDAENFNFQLKRLNFFLIYAFANKKDNVNNAFVN